MVGRSFCVWTEGSSGLQVFGRSAGLLLAVEGEIASVSDRDLDVDGHPELVVSMVTGKGTGVFESEQRVYVFDGSLRFRDLTGDGFADVAEAVERHHAHLGQADADQQAARASGPRQAPARIIYRRSVSARTAFRIVDTSASLSTG